MSYQRSPWRPNDCVKYLGYAKTSIARIVHAYPGKILSSACSTAATLFSVQVVRRTAEDLKWIICWFRVKTSTQGQPLVQFTSACFIGCPPVFWRLYTLNSWRCLTNVLRFTANFTVAIFDGTGQVQTSSLTLGKELACVKSIVYLRFKTNALCHAWKWGQERRQTEVAMATGNGKG